MSSVNLEDISNGCTHLKSSSLISTSLIRVPFGFGMTITLQENKFMISVLNKLFEGSNVATEIRNGFKIKPQILPVCAKQNAKH